MNKNFAMMVLQTVSHPRPEACPPPCVNITNKLQPFGHRRGIKTSTRPPRFAQLAEPVLPLLRARAHCTLVERNSPECRSGVGRNSGEFRYTAVKRALGVVFWMLI